MPDSVTFYGTADTDFVALSVTEKRPDVYRLVLRCAVDGKETVAAELGVSTGEIQRLAQWLETFWDPCEPASLADGRLVFTYSHREHIGEGYFDISLDGQLLLRAYEQLGNSNTYRANILRQLVT